MALSVDNESQWITFSTSETRWNSSLLILIDDEMKSFSSFPRNEIRRSTWGNVTSVVLSAESMLKRWLRSEENLCKEEWIDVDHRGLALPWRQGHVNSRRPWQKLSRNPFVTSFECIRVNITEQNRFFCTYVNRQRYSNDLFRPPLLSRIGRASMSLNIHSVGVPHPKRWHRRVDAFSLVSR